MFASCAEMKDDDGHTQTFSSASPTLADVGAGAWFVHYRHCNLFKVLIFASCTEMEDMMDALKT